MTKNDLKKQRIKKFFINSLHILSYILSVLFIICAIVGGVQSCSNKAKSVNAENEIVLPYKNKKGLKIADNQLSLWTLKYSPGDYEIPLYNQVDLFGSNTVNSPYTYSQPSLYISVLEGDLGYLVRGSNSYEITNFYATLQTYQYDSGNYFYRLSYLTLSYLVDGQVQTASVLGKKEDNANDYFYTFYDNQTNLVLTSQAFDNVIINFFYYKHQQSNFVFNKQFNYNAPLNTTIDGLYGYGSFTYTGPDSAYIVYNTGLFLSNARVYNQIKVWYFKTGAIDVLFSDGVGRAPSGYYVYGMTEYNNTNDNTSIVVNVHDQIPYKTDGGGYTYYYANSSTWKNDAFRSIIFFEDLDASLSISLNAFNNNNQNYYSGQIYNDGSDVFTLLSLGFSSLADFWAISILPGISIGVLFFLPAVVGVIIIIVHILRK